MADSEVLIPYHVGIILDGNRRWAKMRGKMALQGHKAGHKAFKKIASYAAEKGIKELSAYVFSTENWSRGEDEVRGIMSMIKKILSDDLDDFDRDGYRLHISGFRERVSEEMLELIDKAVERTKNNTRGVLNICFNYGGRADILEATRKLIREGISPEEVTEEKFSSALTTAGMHDVDLLIRTSETRLSGFLPWESVYAEIYFDTSILWPDFDEKQFDKALDFYANKERRFGS